MTNRGSEELDDVDFAVDGELLDRPQALRGDWQDLQVVDLGQDQVEIVGTGEVA